MNINYPILMNENKTIIIGIGETEDPLPDAIKKTRFWIYAGPCSRCGFLGREIAEDADRIYLRCENCLDEFNIKIKGLVFSEVTYVYWCNRSKFSTDNVELSPSDKALIEKIEREFAKDYEIPRWAVQIIAGRCQKTCECINFQCVFNLRAQ
ncbi:MAG: hypothetical protein Kow0029_03160 [Candidatus Rifleibacteriota bacterium]